MDALQEWGNGLTRYSVVIMRGVPGSGKSYIVDRIQTIAENLNFHTTICSADDYFTDERGNYLFRRRELDQAHRACMETFAQALEVVHDDVIIIDNTNIERRHYHDYWTMADECGYTVHVIEIQAVGNQLQQCFDRCVHRVPYDAILGMYQNLNASRNRQEGAVIIPMQ